MGKKPAFKDPEDEHNTKVPDTEETAEPEDLDDDIDEPSEDSDEPDTIQYPGKTVSIKGEGPKPAIVPYDEDHPHHMVKTQEIPRKEMFHDDGSLNIESLFDLLGSDIRRKILSKLSKFPRYASDLAIDLGVTKQAIKKHLTKLVEFGVVEEIKERVGDQKIQYYQINFDIAIFAQMVLTPNYYQMNADNKPDELVTIIGGIHHDPKQALSGVKKDDDIYGELNKVLGILGKELHEVEQKVIQIEQDRQKLLLEKTGLLNRLQMIINSLVENDLEKEVLFSVFFDVNSSVKGLRVEDIVNQMFLLKKTRAGIARDSFDKKADEKMQERGRRLLKLLQVFLENFNIFQTEGRKIFFDMEMEK